jgi:hypothetical protein
MYCKATLYDAASLVSTSVVRQVNLLCRMHNSVAFNSEFAFVLFQALEINDDLL